jgi:hypothetical protein
MCDSVCHVYSLITLTHNSKTLPAPQTSESQDKVFLRQAASFVSEKALRAIEINNVLSRLK